MFKYRTRLSETHILRKTSTRENRLAKRKIRPICKMKFPLLLVAMFGAALISACNLEQELAWLSAMRGLQECKRNAVQNYWRTIAQCRAQYSKKQYKWEKDCCKDTCCKYKDDKKSAAPFVYVMPSTPAVSAYVPPPPPVYTAPVYNEVKHVAAPPACPAQSQQLFYLPQQQHQTCPMTVGAAKSPLLYLANKP